MPSEEYDIETTIREKAEIKFRKSDFEAKLKNLEKSILTIAFKPLQDLMDNPESYEEDTIERREANWKEVFNFYKINFNEHSSWYDTFELDSKTKINNAEMPDQDNIPVSTLKKIGKFLIGQGVTNVNINSLTNIIGHQHLIHESSESRKLKEIIEYDNIHILNSLDNDWIFTVSYTHLTLPTIYSV